MHGVPLAFGKPDCEPAGKVGDMGWRSQANYQTIYKKYYP